jgi:hypothetical protein
MQLDPSVMPHQSVYKLLIGCVVPRPIAWVSTVSAEGVCSTYRKYASRPALGPAPCRWTLLLALAG